MTTAMGEVVSIENDEKEACCGCQFKLNYLQKKEKGTQKCGFDFESIRVRHHNDPFQPRVVNLANV